MMTTMQALQLFDNGDYMVIYADTKINSWKDTPKYLWSNLTHFIIIILIDNKIKILSYEFIFVSFRTTWKWCI